MSTQAMILVAEDDDGHFALIERNLLRSGVVEPIVRFRDGQEVLDYLSNAESCDSANLHRPMLILLDIRMPKMDGVTVLEKIKSHPIFKKIPVFMLTTTDDPSEINHCYRVGCNCYIVKPSNYEKFMQTMERLGAFLTTPGLTIPEIAPEKFN